MRNYIFRGKKVYGDGWAYGSLVQRGDYCAILEDNDEDIFLDAETGVIDGNLTPVVPETAGQWTGYKNIYEGDIISVNDTFFKAYGIVKFGEIAEINGSEKHIGVFIDWIDDGANRWSQWWRTDLLYWAEQKNMMFSVIGNIHDNPELLEEQHE